MHWCVERTLLGWYVERGIYSNDWGNNEFLIFKALSNVSDAPPSVGSILSAHGIAVIFCIVHKFTW